MTTDRMGKSTTAKSEIRACSKLLRTLKRIFPGGPTFWTLGDTLSCNALHGFKRRSDAGHFEVRHRGRGEEPPARTRHPARDPRRSRASRAVGRNAGVGVHLAIELRDEHERQPRLQRLDAPRDRAPDVRQRVELVPHRLRARAGFRPATSPDAVRRPSAAAPAESASGA